MDPIKLRILACIDATDFGPPCSPEEIARAEAVLGRPLPPQLRAVYERCDGFVGPGGTDPLWPLRFDGPAGLAGYNLELRIEQTAPSWAAEAVFYGGDGVGGTYAIRDGVDGVVLWSWRDFDDCPVVARDVYEAWADLQQRHEESAARVAAKRGSTDGAAAPPDGQDRPNP
ncbi:MAG: hypothetical protein AVDCRST_MAG64-2445 [uncultured Phycisphaerae bacterium]|uniref:Knr4/Smi1-like domain-containing protein n=1 Tax=uncultured Phycisphaerae bacterium TaxID=904963 RepID=A0A6J4PDT0_9BACT|nr:MAG: hypothetical protein AVDCRST_MAG64-2445 [uncultured Phycisphaerae bacterium]